MGVSGSVLSDQISCQNIPEIKLGDIYIFMVSKWGKNPEKLAIYRQDLILSFNLQSSLHISLQ